MSDSKKGLGEVGVILNTIVSASSLPVVIKDAEHKVVAANEAFSSLFGTEKARIIGTSAFQHLSEKEFQQLLENDKIALEAEEERVTEEQITNANGTASTLIVRRTVFITPEGEKYLITIFNDISEQKQTLLNLKNSEKLYRGLFDTMSDMFQVVELVYDENGQPSDYVFVDVNPSFEKATGKSKQAIIGKPSKEVFGLVEEYWLQRFHKVAKTDKPLTFENYGHQLNKWVRVNAWKTSENRVAALFLDITEQKEKAKTDRIAKEKAEERETYYKTILNSIGDPVFVQDDQSRLLLVNDAFCDLFNHNREEIIGKTLAEDVTPEERKHFLKVDKQVLRNGQESNSEETVTLKNGQTRHITTRKSRFEDTQGNKFIVGVSHDFTERKKAEELLRKNEYEYRVTLQSLLVGVVVHDAQSHIIHANPAASNILGLTNNQLMELAAIDENWRFVYSDCSNMLAEDFPVNRVISSKKQLKNYELGVERPDRDFVTWLNVNAEPVFAEDGSLEKVVVNFVDITETKQTLQSLKKSEERFGIVIEATQEGIWGWDLETNNTYVSSKWCEIMGYTIDDAELEHTLEGFESRIHPEDYQRVKDSLNNHLQKGTRYDVEYRHLHKSGIYRWQRSVGKAVFGEDGKPIRMAGAIMDITDKKEQLEELTSAYEFLEETGEIAKIGAWEFDIATNKTRFTPQALKIHDLSNEVELSNTDRTKFYTPEIEAKINRLIGQAIEDNVPFDLEVPFTSAKGRQLWVRLQGKGVTEDGKVTRVIGTIQDITERNKTRELLRRSTILLEASQKLAKVGGWELDITSGELFWTNETYRIHGTSPDKFTPNVETGVNFYLPQSRKIVSEAVQNAIETGEGFNLELEILNTQDQKVDVHVTCEVTTENGKPVKLIGIFREITEDKRKQAELRESEMFFRESQRAASIGSYKLDFASGDWTSSEVLDDIFGIDNDHPRNFEGWTSLVFEEDVEMMNTYFNQEILTERKSFNKEYRICRPSDGEVRWVLGLGQLITDKNENLLFMIGTIQDVTERKKQQADLERSTKLFKDAGATAKIGGWDLDIARGELYWTEEVYKIYETTPEEFNPNIDDVVNFFSPESKEATNQALKNAFENGAGYDLELRAVTTKGNEIDIRVTCDVILKEGKPARLIGVAQDITERKSKEKKLQESEQFLKQSQQAAFIGSFKYHFVTEEWSSSEVFDTVLGIDEDYPKKANAWQQIVHDDDKEMMQLFWYKSVIEKREFFKKEYRIVRPIDGKTRWLLVLGQVHFDDSGNHDYMVGTMQDITEQKKAIEALAKSEERFQQVTEASNVWVYEIDGYGLYTYASPQVERILGYTPEELVGKKYYFDLYPEEERNRILQQIFERFNHQGRFQNFEDPIICKDGTILIVESNSFPITNSKGEIIGFRGADRDITARKNAQAEVFRLSQAVEQSPGSVVITNLQGNIEYVNKTFEKVSGYKAQEVLGKNPRIFNSGETSQNEYKGLWETISNKKTWFGEFHNKKKDGTLYWERASIGPLLNSDGEVTDYLAIKEDITKEKLMQQYLYDTLENLDKLVEERTTELKETGNQLALAHKELVSSLEYAKHIQEASIPPENELQNTFSNAFVIYKPKDIVSGDFYWMYKDDEHNELVVALVDCTGHGVPGAMMSMAGVEMLDNIVVSRKIRRPDIVLEDMDEAVVGLLQRKAGIFSSNDGMDMSVVRIIPKTKTFYYSGARSGGVFINNGHVIPLKPDRESIGAPMKQDLRSLHNTE